MVKCRWDLNEENFLKENYLKSGNKGIAKKLNRSVASVSRKIQEMKLVRGKEWNSKRMKLNNPSYNQDIVNKRVKTFKRRISLGELIPYMTGKKNPFFSKYNKTHPRKGKEAPNWKGHSLLKECKYCKKKFKVWKCVFNKVKFCNLECYANYLREFGHSEKVMEAIRKNRKHQKFPKKDSSIEVKIQNFLKQLGIEFFTHQYMKIKHGYQCDILIPSMNLVIECDGDFIHCNPAIYPADFRRFPNTKGDKPASVIWERDHMRTSELLSDGFKVLRLWGSEIKRMELNDFRRKLR